jgi:hypothetical protein
MKKFLRLSIIRYFESGSEFHLKSNLNDLWFRHMFLMDGSSRDRKKVIRGFINNIVAVGNDWRLRAIFNENLLKAYFEALKIEGCIMKGYSFLESLVKLVGIVETSEETGHKIRKFLRERQRERKREKDGAFGKPSLLPPEDDFDPWSLNEKAGDKRRYWLVVMDGYFPASWRPDTEIDSFFGFLRNGIRPINGIQVFGKEKISQTLKNMIAMINCDYFRRLLKGVLYEVYDLP